MTLCTRSHRSAGRQKKATALPLILICLSLMSFMAITAQAATTPQVSAGSSSDGSSAHTLALRSDGTVWAWGDNTYDQLGLGASSTVVTSTDPVAVTGLSGTFSAVAAGDEHSLALKSDGTVWAWGDNTYGQLGDTTPDPNTLTYITSSAVPVQVTGLTSIKAIAAGMGFSMALDTSGNVWTWGRNDLGQLGLGTTVNGFAAVQALSGVTGIAAGAYHALALESSTSVLAWGLDACGQLGDGVVIPSFCILTSNQVSGNVKTTPQPIAGLTGVSSVAAGSFHSLAVMSSNGSVMAWGWNGSGQLGNGTFTDSSSPVPVSNLTGATGLGAGSGHSVALSGTAVWAWGDNLQGQLGNGGTTNSDIPVNVLSGAVGVTAAGDYTTAWKSDGTVWTWGQNDDGELGNGTTTPDSTTPTPTPTALTSFNLSTLLGDMNNDGKVSAVDALLTLEYAVGINPLTLTLANALARGDMNGDGKISAVDALMILEKAVGL